MTLVFFILNYLEKLPMQTEATECVAGLNWLLRVCWSYHSTESDTFKSVTSSEKCIEWICGQAWPPKEDDYWASPILVSAVLLAADDSAIIQNAVILASKFFICVFTSNSFLPFLW